MAAALASAYGSPKPAWPSFLPSLFESVREKILDSKGKVAVGDFLADFSPLEYLAQNGTVVLGGDAFHDEQRLTSVLNRHRSILQNRMVLIGDATAGSPADRFVVPGRNVPVPGVYVTACGAYTLAVAPLHEIREPWRVLVDAFIASALLVIVSFVRWRSKQRELAEANERRLVNRLTWGTVILLFLLAGLLVQWTRVLCDDFVIVSVVLILHPSLEKGVNHLLQRFESHKVFSTGSGPAYKPGERV